MIALPEVKFRLLNDVRLLDEFATPGEGYLEHMLLLITVSPSPRQSLAQGSNEKRLPR